jgi:acetyltransferase-like isoleucine patch superfamily enzyme
MEEHRERPNPTRHLILLTVLIPMVISAIFIGAPLYLIGWLTGLHWSIWFVLSPLIYVAWLLLFLAICARNSRRFGSRHPKPRFVQFKRSDDRSKVNPGMLTVTICMFRFAFITSMPLVRSLEHTSLTRKLVLRSYSPSIHIADNAFIWGSIMDPDLVEIGEGAVIGWAACLAAHSFTARPDGSYVYISAPIKIKRGATIGGATVIEHGSVIGEYAVVENMSFVAPFTVIPPGETWGGVPARCLRKAGERKSSPTR